MTRNVLAHIWLFSVGQRFAVGLHTSLAVVLEKHELNRFKQYQGPPVCCYYYSWLFACFMVLWEKNQTGEPVLDIVTQV